MLHRVKRVPNLSDERVKESALVRQYIKRLTRDPQFLSTRRDAKPPSYVILKFLSNVEDPVNQRII